VRRPRLLAATLSGLLGVLGGVVAGTLLDRHHQLDPLGLGVPMVNQQCTGKSLLVTVGGTSPALLASAVAEDPDHVRYLEVAHSCPTAWNPGNNRTDGYVTYLGPYTSTSQACAVRMTAAHRGDLVTKLHRGNQTPVQCLCYLDYATMPRLRPGMEVDALDGIYVRALQGLLSAIGLNPPEHSTGLYDDQTVQQVTAFQRTTGLPQNGVVDASTWHQLKDQGCRNYTD
jgi:Putative peptidoglycan binding domain